jgi:methylmalonyl-CoA mutase
MVAINKADKQGAEDALRDVRKQYKRNRLTFDLADEEVPVYLTVASDFNDPGTNRFYQAFVARLGLESNVDLPVEAAAKQHVVPPERTRYLAEIVEEIRRYDDWATDQAEAAERLYQLEGAAESIGAEGGLAGAIGEARETVDPENLRALERWDGMVAEYAGDEFVYHVRGQEIKVPLHTETISHTRVPKVAMPRYRSWGDRLAWLLQENVPGEFPYTAGVFPFKRATEDPARMFAGEGPPEQTNARFHYLSEGLPAKRLSTAFDSVTLYGDDPHERPDIYGKVGNSGVSIATVDDAKKLYSGFDLDEPTTSVSMTINGPAPMILAFFLNAAIDQACETYITDNGMWDDIEARIDAIYGDRPRPGYAGDLPPGHDGLGLRLLGVSGDWVLPAEVYQRLKAETISSVRGTVQADILKEDQAQNTCIFSTEFALRMQGDIQQYFVDNDVRNFYSVSISGYHMAEAGANPITQLAFTLANGFTFVENYLARGMHIDDFAPNLSFFFSNGVDAEYAVIGRVARRIWSKAMKHKYGGNDRSQKLKYHIQTSGRSLHAQEISFNDIRTTLQALYALYDNANSLHTNAYDEAITTPTEESVRRAMAIQLIINKELGLNKNENPLQGSFIIEELTDLVEEAVLVEFERLNSRGGVLGAMERQYQRTKIQEESFYYEQKKESGEYPVVGVNTFISKEGSPFEIPKELRRSSAEMKDLQIANLRAFQERNKDVAAESLAELQKVAVHGGNIFEQLMETAKVTSLGQMSQALYEVGGQYRRNM